MLTARSWGLKVNIKKTKVVVFRKNLRLYDYEKVYIDDSLIEIVNTFNYLGLHFNYNGKYTVAEKQLAEQGRKASFALSKQIKDMYTGGQKFGILTLISLSLKNK